MKNYNLVMSTMFGLLILAFSITEYPFVMSTLVHIVDTSSYGLLIPLMVLVFGPLLIGFYLIFRPQILSKFFSFAEMKNEQEIGITNMLSTTFVILGLFIALYAFIYLFQETLRLTVFFSESEVPGIQKIITGETKAEIASYVVEFSVGMLLALKARKLTAFFTKE